MDIWSSQGVFAICKAESSMHCSGMSFVFTLQGNAAKDLTAGGLSASQQRACRCRGAQEGGFLHVAA